MSFRSKRSIVSGSGAVPKPLTDADVYSYALRVAVLQYVIASKPAPVVKSEGAAVGNLRRTTTEAIAGTGSGSSLGWSSLSLGDLFRDYAKSSSGGSPKYPERFVKVLEHKIEAISRGTDSVYTDMLLRYTVGAFYGKYKDPKNARVIKESRKLEDLMMMFIATATEILRKRCTGDEWKVRLEVQVESFVKILEECLRHRDVRHVPPELFTRVENIRSRLVANHPSPEILDRASKGTPASPARASMEVSQSAPQGTPTVTLSYSVADMTAARQIGMAFGVEIGQLQADVDDLKKICTEKAAMLDLKHCVNQVSANAPFPGCREDFPTDEAYDDWKTVELADLQQAMLSMIEHSPELVKVSEETGAASAPNGSSRPTSVATEAGEAYIGSRLSQRSLPIAEQFATSLNITPTASSTSSTSLEESNGVHTPNTDISSTDRASTFTYIPHDVKAAYARLLHILLSYDLGEMANLDPSEEVPLRILSKANQDLLTECAFRWRITQPYRFVTFLGDLSQMYAAGDMPVVECVLEALSDFDPLEKDWPNDTWPVQDRRELLDTISTLFDALLRSFYETFSEQHPSEAIPPIVEALNVLRDNALFDAAVEPDDLEQRFEQLREGVRRVSDFLYGRERELLYADQPLEAVSPVLELLRWIKQTAKRLDKTYKSPLLNEVDIPALFLERVPDLFLQDLSQRLQALAAMQKSQPLYTTPGDDLSAYKPILTDGEVNSLYVGVRELTEMHDAFCPKTPLQVSVNDQFEPYISKWIAETDKKTLGWVRSAINLDDFKPDEDLDAEKHSSSIVDLIASCKGAVQFVTDLGWPDEYQNALFLTKLSATVSKSIEQYCIAIEELFMREMTPAKRDSASERDERTSAWLTRAKALYQDKKLEAFAFKPTSCVKLNNIHAARELLDKMYTAIDADKVSLITRARGPPVPAKNSTTGRNLFTIKIVLGEGLATADGVSRVDPFITLSDERGLRIAKTRTLYETSEPRWAETFDISVEGKMWIAATVWNRNLVDEHELLGRTYLALDPHVYADYLPHDLWQELDTVGRLLLRVSMEGEKDDIQFYFGRAFRSLKRAENDMTRIIVDKISPFIRAALSQSSLRSLLKKGGFSYLTNLNLDKAIDKARLSDRLADVRNLVRTRDPHAAEIPLPPSLFAKETDKPLPMPAGQPKKAPGLTDAEIEQPLSPLLDYLDQSLETFRKYLSESAWQVAMTKIWKEVLSVTEGLLVPALSDQPTEMKPLSDKEVDIVFKWLKFLTDFFYADGGGVPIEDLRNPRYRAVMMIRLYYDWSTDQLMEECVRLTNQQLTTPISGKGIARSKSVYQQRNLGTIRERKKEKNEEADTGAAEMVMRILRMRPGALDFLQQQMTTLNLVQEKQHKPTRLLGSIRGRGKGRAGRGGRAPPLPTNRLSAAFGELPSIPKPDPHQQFRQYR